MMFVSIQFAMMFVRMDSRMALYLNSVEPNFLASYDDQLYVADTHFLSTKLIQIINFKYFFESNDFEGLWYKTCMVELIV